MDFKNLFTNEDQKKKMNWGEAAGLWDITRYKLAGMGLIEIFLQQAQDPELKQSLNLGVEMVIIPHVERIQKFINSEELEVPAIPPRQNLDKRKTEPNTLINDNEIAQIIRENIRYGLLLDIRAFAYSFRHDVRNLINDILNDDIKTYHQTIELHSSKNWLMPPGTV